MSKRLAIVLASLAVGVLPLTAALADQHEELPTDPPITDEPSVEETESEEEAVEEVEEEVEEAEEREVERAEAMEEEDVAEEDLEGEDDGHGEVVSLVAQCAPRGKVLKGTGVNHGTFVSAVAGGAAVVVPAVVDGEVDLEGGQEFTVETPEEAEALCAALETFTADLEAATADAEVEAASAKGPKTQAHGKGKGNAKGAKKGR